VLPAQTFARLDIETPAFIYDEAEIQEKLRIVAGVRSASGCKVLYALKPFAVADALRLMAPSLDGFAVSSLFEARLARTVLGRQALVQLTTPGLRPGEIKSLIKLCDQISFNSLAQWRRFRTELASERHCGLRINPQLPLVEDPRYNPCRPQSKLGVATTTLREVLEAEPGLLSGVAGLHVHTNCDAESFAPLLATVRRVEADLGVLLPRLDWINLGGGYLFETDSDFDPLFRAIERLRSTYGLRVFIEPGAALVRTAGYLASTVIDRFRSDGREVAVLDTSVNHIPEVFEYQFEPEILGHLDGGTNEYLLAGCTCLAGDLFGLYSFTEPLKIGSRVVFTGAGAYTTVKSHMFNGVNLPAIYALTGLGELVLKVRTGYEDFLTRCGGLPCA
jgi:carboxynorspermidine decarboxylase